MRLSIILIFTTSTASFSYAQDRYEPKSIRDYLEEAARVQGHNAPIIDRSYEYGKNKDFGPLSSNDARISVEEYANPRLVVQATDFLTYTSAIPKVLSEGWTASLPALGNLLETALSTSLAGAGDKNESREGDENVRVTSPSEPQHEDSDRDILLKAVDKVVTEALSEGCEDRGGEINARGYFTGDFDSDGSTDLILSHHGVQCSKPPRTSLLCGMRVCSGSVFLRRGDELVRAANFDGTVNGISEDTPPIITITEHNHQSISFQWNGQGFQVR